MPSVDLDMISVRILEGKIEMFSSSLSYLNIYPSTMFSSTIYFSKRNKPKIDVTFIIFSTYFLPKTYDNQQRLLKAHLKLLHPLLLLFCIAKHFLVDGCTYVPEPPMGDGKRKVLYSDVLIPYSISGSNFSFMATHPMYVKKPNILKLFFPSYLGCEPLVFHDKSFVFSFLKNRVFKQSPPIGNAGYIKWLDMVQYKKNTYGNIRLFST